MTWYKNNLHACTFTCLFYQQIVDPNTNEICGVNERGEICVKTDFMMMGYLNRKTANKEVFDSHGFIRTGDIGYYDNSGIVYYFDRLKEVIK